MAQRLAYTRVNKLPLLHEQLIAAGITPLRVEGLGNDIWITVADGVSSTAVDAVVTAHDPAVLSAGEVVTQEITTAKSDLQTQYAAAISRLDDIVTNGATFTAAQVRDAVIDLARMTRRLLRLVRNVLT